MLLLSIFSSQSGDNDNMVQELSVALIRKLPDNSLLWKHSLAMNRGWKGICWFTWKEATMRNKVLFFFFFKARSKEWTHRRDCLLILLFLGELFISYGYHFFISREVHYLKSYNIIYCIIYQYIIYYIIIYNILSYNLIQCIWGYVCTNC